MKVIDLIRSKVKKEKIHMTLIDPAAQPVEKSAFIAKEADRAGTDFIMIGGSTEVDFKKMCDTINKIKRVTEKKVIIFPGSSSMISPEADAIYFMTLMNSNKPEYIMRHQVKAAPYLKQMRVETIPMGYLVFSPGMTVGKVGGAELIDRKDSETAISYALAAQMFGMKLVYLESGSGSPTYVDRDVVSRVKSEIDIPLLVGGGIRSKEAASDVSKAGADIIVTGTITEKTDHVFESLVPVIEGVKE